MKKQLIQVGITLGLVMMPAITRAADETALGKQMEEFDGAYKAFRKETDPAKGAELAREAQGHVLKTIGEVPELVSVIADPLAKAKALAEYRKMMGKVFVSLVEVEEAFLANNLDKVAEIIESLKEQKKEGHDKFMEKE